MPAERFTFDNGRGQQLAARLDSPAEPRAYAIFAHCFTCGKNARAAYTIGQQLAEHGIATLRFDFTGLDESEGAFELTTFSSNIDDLLAAANYLEQHYAAPQLLIGHSLGGPAVIHAAPRIGSVRAVAIIGSPQHPRHVLRRLRGHEDELEQQGWVKVEISGKTSRIGKDFADDVAQVDMDAALANLGVPLLVCHAPDDEGVPFAQARALFDAAREPKQFLTIEGGDHLLLNKELARWVGDQIATWAEPHLEN